MTVEIYSGMSDRLVARALFHEVAPSSPELHVEARKYLAEQEQISPASLLVALTQVYDACTQDEASGQFANENFELLQTIEEGVKNEYEVGRHEVKLMCIISIRAVWQRSVKSKFEAADPETAQKLNHILVFLMRELHAAIYKAMPGTLSEQIITTVTTVARYLIPYLWEDLLKFMLVGLKKLIAKDVNDMQVVEFAALLLQFLQIQSSRRLNSTQRDFIALFKSTEFLPLVFIWWGSLQETWERTHGREGEAEATAESLAAVFDRRTMEHNTSTLREFSQIITCADSITMTMLTYFNCVESIMTRTLELDAQACETLNARRAGLNPSLGDYFDQVLTYYSVKVNDILSHQRVYEKSRRVTLLARIHDCVSLRPSYLIAGKSRFFLDLKALLTFGARAERRRHDDSDDDNEDEDDEDFDDENVMRSSAALDSLLRSVILHKICRSPRYGWVSQSAASGPTHSEALSEEDRANRTLFEAQLWPWLMNAETVPETLLRPLEDMKDLIEDAPEAYQDFEMGDWVDFCSGATEVLDPYGMPITIYVDSIKALLSRRAYLYKCLDAAIPLCKEALNKNTRTAANRRGARLMILCIQQLCEDRWELMAILKPRTGDSGGSVDTDAPTPQAELNLRHDLSVSLSQLLETLAETVNATAKERLGSGTKVDHEVALMIEVAAALSDMATAAYHSPWMKKLESIVEVIVWDLREGAKPSAAASRARGGTKNYERFELACVLCSLCLRHLTCKYPDALIAISLRRRKTAINAAGPHVYQPPGDDDARVWGTLTYLTIEMLSNVTNDDLVALFPSDSFRVYLSSIVDEAMELQQHLTATWGQKFNAASALIALLSCFVSDLLPTPDEVRALWNPVVKTSGLLMNMLDVGFGKRVATRGERVKMSLAPTVYEASPSLEKTHYQFPSANVSPHLIGTDMETTSLCLLGIRLLIHAVGMLGGHRGASAYGAEVPVIQLHQAMMVKLEATFAEITLDPRCAESSDQSIHARPSLLLRTMLDLWLEIVLWIRVNKTGDKKRIVINNHWDHKFIISFLRLTRGYFSSGSHNAMTRGDLADMCHRLWRLAELAEWSTECQTEIEQLLLLHPVTCLLLGLRQGRSPQELLSDIDPDTLRAQVRRAPVGLRAEYRRCTGDDSVDIERERRAYKDAVSSTTSQVLKEKNASIVLGMSNHYTLDLQEDDVTVTIPISNLHSIFHELELLAWQQ